jgi:hypothetical protein
MIARLTLALTVSGLALLTAAPAFAANNPNRNQIVSKCVNRAQTQVPSRGDDTSVQQGRMAIYTSCMRSYGLRP